MEKLLRDRLEQLRKENKRLREEHARLSGEYEKWQRDLEERRSVLRMWNKGLFDRHARRLSALRRRVITVSSLKIAVMDYGNGDGGENVLPPPLA
jgi:predicted nuclease with TOPRIM domain